MDSNFKIEDTKLDGLKIITPFYIEDKRGYFIKSMERTIFKNYGLDADVDESFETYSRKNVIRGLHFQMKYPQTKYIRAIRGAVYDVAVDLRRESETFGKWMGIELSDKNHHGLWIPGGFAHGFSVLSEEAVIAYQCTGRYIKEYDTGIRWDDPDLSIDWGIKSPVVSERDSGLQNFRTWRYSTEA